MYFRTDNGSILGSNEESFGISGALVDLVAKECHLKIVSSRIPLPFSRLCSGAVWYTLSFNKPLLVALVDIAWEKGYIYSRLCSLRVLRM